jgi:hypothetical protein
MGTPTSDELTGEERRWALHSEALWARAYRIAETHPGVDAGDIYHALRCLELDREIEGVSLRVLPLDRVLASKRATGRAKDTAQIPVLEATLLARDESNTHS